MKKLFSLELFSLTSILGDVFAGVLVGSQNCLIVGPGVGSSGFFYAFYLLTYRFSCRVLNRSIQIAAKKQPSVYAYTLHQTVPAMSYQLTTGDLKQEVSRIKVDNDNGIIRKA